MIASDNVHNSNWCCYRTIFPQTFNYRFIVLKAEIQVYFVILIFSYLRITYPWTKDEQTLVTCDPIFKTGIDDIRYLGRNFIKSLTINYVLN